MNIIKRTPVTVSGILAGFQKTIDQLSALAATKQAEASSLYDQAQRTRTDARTAEEECAKANAAAAKIAQLIG